MTLTQNLNNLAQQCAKYYAAKGSIDKSCPYKNGAGGNLAIAEGNFGGVSVVDMGARIWYDEIKDYDFNNPGFSFTTGYFTQVVWNASTRLGIGYASGGSTSVAVALHNPPGNVEGQYPQNVARPR
jgi:hypothetical protein